MVESGKLRGPLGSLSIRSKLLLCFLGVSLVPLLLNGLISSSNTSSSLKEAATRHLEAVADGAINRIDRYCVERMRDVTLLSRHPVVVEGVVAFEEVFHATGHDSADHAGLRQQSLVLFEQVMEDGGVYDIFLVDPGGDVVFTVFGEATLGTNLFTGPYRDSALGDVTRSAAHLMQVEVSDFEYDAPSDLSAAFIAAPILAGDRFLGVVAVQISADEINSLASDYTGLARTGEMVLASSTSQGLQFVTPTRHDPDAAFQRSVDAGAQSAKPIQEAVKGNTGIGVYEDYRGVEVIAAWRYQPQMRLGVVVKMDTEEAFAAVGTLSTWLLSVLLLTLSLVALVSLVVARSISRPIVDLTGSMASMTKGDLDVRAAISGKDEVAKLAEGFNTMSGSLRESRDLARRRDWQKTSVGRLSDVMRGEKDVLTLGRDIVACLAELLGARIGAIYLLDGEQLELAGMYAYETQAGVPERFALGAGLVGQAAVDGKLALITDVPDDYVVVASALGRTPPRQLVVLPFRFDDRIQGVIELGTLEAFSDEHLELLHHAAESIGIAVNVARARARQQALLEETQRQSEELQAQQEELRASNEELERQTQALKQSEEELKAQQEELQVTNEELEQKNDALARRKRDVERANAELEETGREIAKKAEELALASRYKSEFLANMSHELRTPLNSLLLLSRSLADNKDGNLTGEQVEAAGIVNSSGNDLLELINEILDLAKIEAGHMALRLERIALRELAVRTKSRFQHMAEDKGLALEIRVDEGAPEAVVTDRGRVEQVIRNLVGNALKFTKTGGVNVSFGRPPGDVDLSRSGLDPARAIVLTVTDTGIGIPVDKQEMVFEAFQQATGGTARQYGGTGLGLSICRELAQLLGGEIQLHSEEGRGSSFAFYLPLDPGEHARESAAETEERRRDAEIRPPAGVAAPARRPPATVHVPDDRDSLEEGERCILIVEDDPRFAGVLVRWCREKGIKCLAAPTGEDGLELAEKYVPAAIILDIRLPGADGWSVLGALKDNPMLRHIPVHIMSAEEASLDALRRGAIGHLTKPVTAEHLEDAFERLEHVFNRKLKKLLVVEDDDDVRSRIVRLIDDEDVACEEVATGAEAIRALEASSYDCVILDLGLPDMSGFELLEALEAMPDMVNPPVVVYTGRELSRDETVRLRQHTESIIVKGVKSEERLLDEASLFLHRVVAEMPSKKQRIIKDLHGADTMFKDKTILIVDDDMRNVFALARLLGERGFKTLKAENGQKALELLDRAAVDLVLMDVMMPGMDGYETTQRIRSMTSALRNIPIIALTAKAMTKDRQKCIEAGANDYLSKPVDVNRLLSMMRVWLYR